MTAGKIAGVGSLFLIFLCAGCSSGGGGGPAGDTVRISGTVWQDVVGGATLSDVQVTAYVDINGDGSLGDGESASSSSDFDGKFEIDAPAKAGKETILKFSLDGYAQVFKTVTVQQSGIAATLDVVMHESESMNCSGQACVASSGAASVSGIDIEEGYVRVFNPATEADAFPGAFRDDAGNSLVSSVFASFELYDADGNRITKIADGESAVITMRIPRDTWDTLGDMVPGDDRIQVPMYYFDEDAGQWRQEGMGWLVGADGTALAEADLASLKDGSFSGEVAAMAPVTHFSYWNVDWPSREGTTIVVIVDPPPEGDDKTAAGAVCWLTSEEEGASPPVVIGEDGKACFDVMRSEAAGEDLDEDGVTGEISEVYLLCRWHDRNYRFGPFEVGSEAAGFCPAVGTDVGSVTLDSQHEVSAEICSISGTVLRNGEPLEGASLTMEDPSIPDELRDSLCSAAGGCMYVAMTDASGHFEMNGPFAFSLKLEASYADIRPEAYIIWKAVRNFGFCPQQPIVVNLELESCTTMLPEIQYDDTSNQISWNPPVLLEALWVIGASGSGWPLWMIRSDSGITSPVTYGQVPDGATQVYPQSNEPPQPVSSGDYIQVYPMGGFMDIDGLRCYSNSLSEIP
ncbi:MAG: hypothetical protein D6806_07145 [Deltaproteobacteria bacterium]|nr:MAG: hypothetical protein D6806_07145 [Deltaproteobacteria bacterium]